MLTEEQISKVIRLSEETYDRRRGGNSTVSRIVLGADAYAVKNYSNREDGVRRQIHETAALTLLQQERGGYFAHPVGVSPDGYFAVHSWIDGVRPASSESSTSHMLDILNALHILSKTTSPNQANFATDHVLRTDQIHAQLSERIAGLLNGPLEVARITRQRLVPALASLHEFHGSVSSPVATLSPSDFGVHNLLWNEERQTIHCVDLEFFGWDDAHKLVLDSLLHPLAHWSLVPARDFLSGSIEMYQLDVRRLSWLWPRLCLKWAAIVLSRVSRNLESGDDTGAVRGFRIADWYLHQEGSAPKDAPGMLESVVELGPIAHDS